MGIGIYDEGNPHLFCAASVDPVHIQSFGLGIDLDHGPAFGCSGEHCPEVHGITIALKQKPAGGVTEHGYLGVADSADDSSRDFIARLLEMSVHTGNNVIETCQDFVS